MTSINRSIRWVHIDTGDWALVEAKGKVKGWILRGLVNFSEVFVATCNDGEVRVEFPTLDEAKDFLWAIVHMEQA